MIKLFWAKCFVMLSNGMMGKTWPRLDLIYTTEVLERETSYRLSYACFFFLTLP